VTGQPAYPGDLTDPALAPAWHLRRAGQWDLALAVLGPAGAGSAGAGGTAAAALRAEILVDRHAWQLDPPGEALAAVEALTPADPVLAGYLAAQLEYWRQVFSPGAAGATADLPAAFGAAAADPRIGGWAALFQALARLYLAGDPAAAAAGFDRVLAAARAAGDALLESYAVRHQAELAQDADPGRAAALARRSLALRAALGARPQCAAAQAMLADLIPDGPEARELRQLATQTAAELGLTWLLPAAGP
jgi:hypothetical protein